MTPTETVLLTRYVKACCPQQAIDEYTPDAWHDLLGHLALDEAKTAVIAVTQRQPFCAPSEILAEVRRIRNQAEPHSQACRRRDCKECVWTWCRCACHPDGRLAIEAAS